MLHTNLLVVWPRSPDPDGDIAVAELFCILLEGRDDASECGRHVSEVGYASPDDQDLSTRIVQQASKPQKQEHIKGF